MNCWRKQWESSTVHYEEPTSELSDDKDTVIKEWIPATPDVKNYSYTKVGDVFYYREDSRMYRQELTGKKAERVDGMLRIRDALRELMDFPASRRSRTGMGAAHHGV